MCKLPLAVALKYVISHTIADQIALQPQAKAQRWQRHPAALCKGTSVSPCATRH